MLAALKTATRFVLGSVAGALAGLLPAVGVIYLTSSPLLGTVAYLAAAVPCWVALCESEEA